MIYFLLFVEFFKIGLLAIGGGVVTIPFLLDLAEKYDWYTKADLLNMIAISESTPGPVGVNMATYVGYVTGGVWGSMVATLGLVLPSVVIIILIAKYLYSKDTDSLIQRLLFGVRPAVVALILYAGWELAWLSLVDYKSIGISIAAMVLVRILKWHPIIYICMAAVIGIVLKL